MSNTILFAKQCNKNQYSTCKTSDKSIIYVYIKESQVSHWTMCNLIPSIVVFFHRHQSELHV